MYGHTPPNPKTKFGKFLWYVLFPSFIFSIVISALIEQGIKYFGSEAELTQIFFIVFAIIFFVLLFMKIKSALCESSKDKENT